MLGILSFSLFPSFLIFLFHIKIYKSRLWHVSETDKAGCCDFEVLKYCENNNNKKYKGKMTFSNLTHNFLDKFIKERQEKFHFFVLLRRVKKTCNFHVISKQQKKEKKMNDVRSKVTF
jgi:hypothetical protein